MNSKNFICTYLERYGIRAIRLTRDTGVDNTTPVCNVYLALKDREDEPPVLFKLQDDQAGYVDQIAAIDARGEITPATAGTADNTVAETALDFLRDIEPRVVRIKQEEDIQAITFVGNSFLINKVIEIRVLEDDGEGHLAIELRRDGTTEQAVMLANDLMDGLYLGSIIEKETEINRVSVD